MLHITKDNFKEEVELCDKLVVIDLYADWCGPCKMLAPIVEELEKEMSDVKFAKINVDDEGELARLFNVSSIPMIAVVKENVLLDVNVGYSPKATLAEFIDQYR